MNSSGTGFKRGIMSTIAVMVVVMVIGLAFLVKGCRYVAKNGIKNVANDLWEGTNDVDEATGVLVTNTPVTNASVSSTNN